MDDDYRVYDVDGGYSDYYGTSYYDERSAVWFDYHTVTPPSSSVPGSSTPASSFKEPASPTTTQFATTTTEHYSWSARDRGSPPTLPSFFDLEQTTSDADFIISTTLAPSLGWNLFTPSVITTTAAPYLPILVNNFTANATAAVAAGGGSPGQPPPPPYPVPVVVFICLFLGTISLATAVGNIFVISAILTEKSLQSVANYLIMSLAVSDFLVATTVMPFALALEASRGQWIFGAYVCDMWTIFDVLCCTASILHLVSIAIDRYWAITSVQYIQNRTSKRIGTMLLIVWIVASTIAILPMLFFKDAQEFADRIAQNECKISDDKAFRVGGGLFAFWMPLFAILLIYWKIWKAAKSRIRKKDFKAHGNTGVEKLPLRQRLLARLRRQSNTSVSSMPEASSSSPNPAPSKDAVLDAPLSSLSMQRQLDNHHQQLVVSTGPDTFNSLAVTPGGGDSSGSHSNGSSSNNRYRHSPRVSDALLSNSNNAPASSSSDASSSFLHTHQPQSNHVEKRISAIPPVSSPTPYQQPTADWASRSPSMEDEQDFRKAMLLQQPNTVHKLPANGNVVSIDRKDSKCLNFSMAVHETKTLTDDVGGAEFALTGAPVIVLRRSILVFRAEELDDARLASSPLVVNELTPACIRKKQIGSKPPSTTTTTTTTTLSVTQSTGPQTAATPGEKNFVAEEQGRNHSRENCITQHLEHSDAHFSTKAAESENPVPSLPATTASNADVRAKVLPITPKVPPPTITPQKTRSLTSSDNSSLTGQQKPQFQPAVVGGGGGGSSSNSKLTPNHNSQGRKSGGGVGKRNSTNTTGGRKQDSKEYQAKQKEKKAAKTLAIITFCFCICWIGFFTLQLVEPFCGHDGCSWSSPLLFSIFNWLGYSNSMLNPILYTIFSPDFRRAFKRILLGRKAVQQQSRVRR